MQKLNLLNCRFDAEEVDLFDVVAHSSSVIQNDYPHRGWLVYESSPVSDL